MIRGDEVLASPAALDADAVRLVYGRNEHNGPPPQRVGTDLKVHPDQTLRHRIVLRLLIEPRHIEVLGLDAAGVLVGEPQIQSLVRQHVQRSPDGDVHRRADELADGHVGRRGRGRGGRRRAGGENADRYCEEQGERAPHDELPYFCFSASSRRWATLWPSWDSGTAASRSRSVRDGS